MIAALAARLLVRPWARMALRWGAVALAVLLFLLPSGAPASAPGGWRSVSKPWRTPMEFIGGCWRPRLAGLVVATGWLAACAPAGSERPVAVCTPVAEYSPEFQARAADELELLPDGAAIAEMLSDYAVMREQAGLAGLRRRPKLQALRSVGSVSAEDPAQPQLHERAGGRLACHSVTVWKAWPARTSMSSDR